MQVTVTNPCREAVAAPLASPTRLQVSVLLGSSWSLLLRAPLTPGLGFLFCSLPAAFLSRHLSASVPFVVCWTLGVSLDVAIHHWPRSRHTTLLLNPARKEETRMGLGEWSGDLGFLCKLWVHLSERLHVPILLHDCKKNRSRCDKKKLCVVNLGGMIMSD